MSDKIRTTTIIGKCPYCGGEVVETKYAKHAVTSEPPQPECTSCNREMSESEVKK